MTTKLEAINTILSCIGQAPLNTLEGTKSYFTISAEEILDDETRRIQMTTWNFNSENDYPLTPDVNGTIIVPQDVLAIEYPTEVGSRYVVREGKVYDKINHTFEIREQLRVNITFSFPFEKCPEVVQEYAMMSAAYKFVKRALGSQATCQYTLEDLVEARIAMEQHELEEGNYTMIPDMYNGNIRSAI